MKHPKNLWSVLLVAAGIQALATLPASAADKKPNIVMLMTDDTGWNDLGAYSGGGAALGHPTPNLDRLASEGAMFTSWVRASKLHGGPCLVHDGTRSDPLGAVDRGFSR